MPSVPGLIVVRVYQHDTTAAPRYHMLDLMNRSRHAIDLVRMRNAMV